MKGLARLRGPAGGQPCVPWLTNSNCATTWHLPTPRSFPGWAWHGVRQPPPPARVTLKLLTTGCYRYRLYSALTLELYFCTLFMNKPSHADVSDVHRRGRGRGCHEGVRGETESERVGEGSQEAAREQRGGDTSA